jgi:hypothetical protein
MGAVNVELGITTEQIPVNELQPGDYFINIGMIWEVINLNPSGRKIIVMAQETGKEFSRADFTFEWPSNWKLRVVTVKVK